MPGARLGGGAGLGPGPQITNLGPKRPRSPHRTASAGRKANLKAGIWNLGFGLLAVAAGASGQFVLPGTSTPTPLVVLGALLAAYGVFQLWQSRGR